MKIAVYGLGYVGSINAACLAELGHEVIGVDIKKEKVERVNNGFSPVREPDIEELIKKHSGKNLRATTNIRDSLENSEIGILCVGTPLNYDDKLDVSRVFIVFDEIIKNLDKPYLVIVKSTVPPGTLDSLKKRTNGKNVKIIMNPEFLREGSGVEDFFNPSIIVIGSSDKSSAEVVKKMYDGVNGKIILTNEKIAEMIKYVNNSWHAIKIAFTNEISSIASRIEINPYDLMEIFCGDEKLNISKRYLRPGFAYGGSCLPKDTSALVSIGHKKGLNIPLIENVERSNQEIIERALRIILNTGEKNIGIVGLSFKYDGTSGDIRGSPIVRLINRLIESGFTRLFDKGFDIKIYDPYMEIDEFNKYLPFMKYFKEDNIKKLVRESKLIVIGNFMPELKKLIESLEDHHILFDLQGVIKPSEMKKGKYIGLY